MFLLPGSLERAFTSPDGGRFFPVRQRTPAGFSRSRRGFALSQLRGARDHPDGPVCGVAGIGTVHVYRERRRAYPVWAGWQRGRHLDPHDRCGRWQNTSRRARRWREARPNRGFRRCRSGHKRSSAPRCGVTDGIAAALAVKGNGELLDRTGRAPVLLPADVHGGVPRDNGVLAHLPSPLLGCEPASKV